MVRTGSFRRGWKWRLQDQSKTYREEVKTGELAAVSSLTEPCTLLQTWMPQQTYLKRYYTNGREAGWARIDKCVTLIPSRKE